MSQTQQPVKLMPKLTERTTSLSEQEGVYTFRVWPLNASKTAIKAAVKALYNVDIQAVRTQVIAGKRKRRGRQTGKQSTWKKALVKVGPGQTIDFFATAPEQAA